MMQALVTGASGFVGSHLVKRLVQDGHTVYALVRNTSKVDVFDGITPHFVYGDLRDQDSLERIVQEHPDIDTVFHMAGVITPVSKGEQIYWDSNYAGTQHVLDACRKLPLKAFINCSSVGVIGPLPEIPANEETRCAPDSSYGESKYKAELLALEYQQKFDLPIAVVRPAWCYGPGDRRTYKFFHMVAKGRFFFIGDGQTKLHPVYVDDVAQGVIACAEHIADAAGKVFIIAGPESVTLEYLALTAATAAGSSLLPFKVPVDIAKLGATLCEACCKPFGIEPPIHHRRLDFYLRAQSFDSSKITNTIGFEPHVDVATGVAKTIQWYQEHGWL
jgi:nucleoside-diphosphate-sugar epimerase